MIYLEIPSLPPSTNHAYITLRGSNKRILSPEGRAYKETTKAHVARTYGAELLKVDPQAEYLMYIRLSFEELYTKGWPTKAKSKFHRIDVSNRVKLLEDALKDVLAVDDSQTMLMTTHKVQGTPRTQVWLWTLEEEESPFDSFIRLRA